MGQIYSFLGYASSPPSTAGNNHNQEELLRYNFTCKICQEILHDPVQCQNDEHYFCRKCITKHLRNSQTCPLCFNQLTIETIRPPSRIIANVVSNFKKPRCSYVSRGCDENVKFEELSMHERTCAYAPFSCPNEGCGETVNRRDKEVHKTEECKFRKIICESCAEEMVYVDYFKKHQCNLTLRREIDRMNETLKQLVATVTEHTLMLATKDRSGERLNNQQIYIFGGELFNDNINKSVEVFDCSTKTWTLIKNCLVFSRYQSFSFIYEKKIMVCGGMAERIEYLNPSESGYTSTVSPVSLRSNAKHNGVLYENRIITFNKGVVGTSLEYPSTSRTLREGKQCRDYAGVHRFGFDIYVVGGQPSKMEKYNVAQNKLKTLPYVPYKVSNMATVVYKDNIVLLGGNSNPRWSECKPLRDVVMFNVTTQEYTRLPHMLEKRSGCAAVIMGDLIVVMGGETDNEKSLKTVEFLVIGNSAWERLPSMNMERYASTACVYMN